MVQGTRYRSSVPLGTAVNERRMKSEARGNQPQATEGLPNVIPAREQSSSCHTRAGCFCMRSSGENVSFKLTNPRLSQ